MVEHVVCECVSLILKKMAVQGSGGTRFDELFSSDDYKANSAQSGDVYEQPKIIPKERR